ncbi:phosphatase 2A-associated protein [Elsinoe ampelina]|uniref:Phosphatase 2A-associated protein n=1 Tax=Elsinoe ampelina TaxID=302913 RepID=A0A6A6GMA5_9PEZI|nr:phosphatase 2A-associated protein [Elsinoe ampelina]
MSGETMSLRSLYQSAEGKRQKLSQLPSSNAPEFQDILNSALSDYQKALDTVDRGSIFSRNEIIDDVSTSDIRYFLLRYYLADLTLKKTGGDRKAHVKEAQSLLTAFLKQLDSHDILTKPDAKLLERFLDTPDTFSIASSADPAARREIKIRRFREEKELKQRLSVLQSQSSASQDDEIARDLYLQQISFAVHQTFQTLESIAQELHILSMAPPTPPDLGELTLDSRDRERRGDGYSERLDGPSHLSAGLKGPLLDSKGKPMRLFTLLDKRTQLQQGVFRPDHSLPTMTIDEYLEEERRRGGIIEGGGPNSGLAPEPDEDNLEKADAETMKARAWDDFKDENPKGAGNTLNRG